MRKEGFPEKYINKYLLGKVSEEVILNTLIYIRTESHAPNLFMFANTSVLKCKDTPLLVDCIVKGGYIRQDGRDIVGKYDSSARYYTVPEKREELALMLSKDLNESLKPFESIDCVNADLNHRTKACVKCLTTYKERKTFCRKCLRKLDDIDTSMLDIIFDLNKKVYRTEFCCSGHPEREIYDAYLVVSGIINGVTAPNGFRLKYKDHKTIITCLNVKKGKVKPSTVELEKLARKNLGDLREWVIELPGLSIISMGKVFHMAL